MTEEQAQNQNQPNIIATATEDGAPRWAGENSPEYADSLRISYDNRTDEIMEAMKRFHRRFGRTRRILMYIAYGIAIVLGVNMIVVDFTGWYGYVLTGMGVFFLSQQIYHPVMARKRLAAALENMSEERYSATFREDYIEIDTLVINAEQTDKTYIKLGSEELHSEETSGSFLLYVNRRLVYLFPKRCLTGEQAERLRGYFTGKGI
jgi:hypothetical protein